MRVKKPKSKRTSTKLREGIHKKAAAKRRKDAKKAKKDVTWKSRKPKAFGIPSSFPYKDKILQEVEQAKMMQRAEAERKREEKRAERAALRESGEMVDDADEEVADQQDSMAALMESAQAAAEEFEGGDEDDEEGMDEDEDGGFEVRDIGEEEGDDSDYIVGDSDKSRKQFDKIFKNVVDTADVVLYVLDARDPAATRSKRVEEAILAEPEKRLILLLNKVDLVPEDVLKEWLSYLGQRFPAVPIKASSGGQGTSYNKGLSQGVTSVKLLQSLKQYAQKSGLGRAITVGVIGYPNVGKSSVINALIGRHGRNVKACPVGNEAGVTRGIKEVKVDNKLKILDSPGIVFPEGKKAKDGRRLAAELALLNAIPQRQVADPERAVKLLIQKLSKDNEMATAFNEYYGLPALPTHDLDEFVRQVLIHIARKYGRFGPRGIPNLTAAAHVVLTDWKDGRLKGWTPAPAIKEEIRREEPKQESKGIVQEWAKEFDLDGLLGDLQ